MDPITVLLGVSLILFFGFFAEFLFKKYNVPDILLLSLLGILLGPFALNYISPEQVAGVAPVFTTFALLFLLFDGAFNIDLTSFARGLTFSFVITLFNFIISTAVITGIMLAFGYDFYIALFTGFVLGGVSSSFVIPLLKNIDVKKETYSIMTLESALSDVLTIVFALATIEIMQLQIVDIQSILTHISSLFAIAGLIGIVGGALWLLVEIHILKEHKSYIVTIAFVIFLYVATEYLQGNGAISALFFGLMLKNSKKLTSIAKGITTRSAEQKEEAMKGDLGVSVTTRTEEFFYDQISFLLKTFFFVYIGMLLDFSSIPILIIGSVIAIAMMITRNASQVLTKKISEFDRKLINSVFARGIAAAAIAQIAIQLGIEALAPVAKITYVVIIATIILSSIRVFIARIGAPKSTSAETPIHKSIKIAKARKTKKQKTKKHKK